MVLSYSCVSAAACLFISLFLFSGFGVRGSGCLVFRRPLLADDGVEFPHEGAQLAGDGDDDLVAVQAPGREPPEAVRQAVLRAPGELPDGVRLPVLAARERLGDLRFEPVMGGALSLLRRALRPGLRQLEDRFAAKQSTSIHLACPLPVLVIEPCLRLVPVVASLGTMPR